MITTKDLYRLGYSKKPENIVMHDGSTDFRHDDFENRSYLVNLNGGVITVAFPVNKPGNPINTDDIAAFTEWHNNYTQ
ncbi:hypothetical protein TPENAI_60913 [Tenacibaculum litopenaei]|uniref:hypothetical protein n=1 Tax=Tenacibaculum litopenaei TaxID=396016 RepID=UPI00389348F1